MHFKRNMILFWEEPGRLRKNETSSQSWFISSIYIKMVDLFLFNYDIQFQEIYWQLFAFHFHSFLCCLMAWSQHYKFKLCQKHFLGVYMTKTGMKKKNLNLRGTNKTKMNLVNVICWVIILVLVWLESDSFTKTLTKT